MTNQEAFNMVWEHFLVKKEPFGIDPETTACRYRGPGGSKCAVGLFISDEVAQAIEGNGLAELDASLFPEFIQKEFDFYTNLQGAHDAAARHGDSWVRDEEVIDRQKRTRLRLGLTELAREWGLELPKEDV